MAETAVLEFDPVTCLPADDNRPGERPGIQFLIDAIRANGQLVPGLVCPHPDNPDRHLILDGVGRCYACSQLRIPFRAILLRGVVTPIERIKLRLQHNAIRRNMTPEEVADDAAQFMQLRACSQAEAARELNLSPASLSRAFSTHRRIPPELKPLVERVRPSVASAIATLPSVEAMRRAFEFATTPGADGKLPTRDQVVTFCGRYKEKTPRGPKPKALKGEVDGRKMELLLLPGESTDSIIEFLKQLAAKMTKYRDLPPDSLGFLFKGGDRSLAVAAGEMS